MKLQLTSPNGSSRRLAVQAFAQEAKTACQPGNLVELPDQGSVRHYGASQQLIADQAILHPYTDQPPGTAQVIADCDVVLKGLERFKGEDAAEMRQSVASHCSKMTKLGLLAAGGGLALGAGLYFAGLGWVGAGAGLLTAAAGLVVAEKEKSKAREFETQLTAWDQAIQTGNPHRLPIPQEGAVQFEYVFMVEKAHIGVSRSYRVPQALLQETPAPTWTGVAPEARTLAAPENVAAGKFTQQREKPRGKFDGPLWPETDVRVPESLAETSRMAEQLDPERAAAPAVQESNGRVTVGGIAVRKKQKPAQ